MLRYMRYHYRYSFFQPNVHLDKKRGKEDILSFSDFFFSFGELCKCSITQLKIKRASAFSPFFFFFFFFLFFLFFLFFIFYFKYKFNNNLYINMKNTNVPSRKNSWGTEQMFIFFLSEQNSFLLKTSGTIN